jgi:hypothetical protein
LISGLEGHDRLISHGGRDTLSGGAGTDTAVIDASAVSEAISGGVPSGVLYRGSTPFVYLSHIEALEYTGNATGTIAGSGVTGGSGNDLLIGLDGDDRFNGGLGNNTIDGGAGSDLAIFDFSDRTGHVELVNGGVAGTTYTAWVDGVASGSVSNVEALGFTGGSGDDRIGGVIGTTLFAVTMSGGAGTDTAVIDASAVSEAISGGVPSGVLYRGSTPFVYLSHIEALEYTGNATGTIAGSGVTGGSGNDLLIGLDGDDRFNGGLGNNTIDGGAGSDLAIFDFSDRTGHVELVNGGVAGATYTALIDGVASGSVTNVEALGVTGGSGDDRIGGVIGTTLFAVTMTGGAGTDTAVIDASAVSEGISGGVPYGGLYRGTTLFVSLSGIEALEYTGNATDTYYSGITGGSGNDPPDRPRRRRPLRRRTRQQHDRRRRGIGSGDLRLFRPDWPRRVGQRRGCRRHVYRVGRWHRIGIGGQR